MCQALPIYKFLLKFVVLYGLWPRAAPLLSAFCAADAVPVLPIVRATQLPTVLARLGRGLRDFLIPPLHAAEVQERVRRCLAGQGAPAPARDPAPVADAQELSGPIGEDPAFVAIKQQLPRLAQLEAPILITGETGTGKELCARALH